MNKIKQVFTFIALAALVSPVSIVAMQKQDPAEQAAQAEANNQNISWFKRIAATLGLTAVVGSTVLSGKHIWAQWNKMSEQDKAALKQSLVNNKYAIAGGAVAATAAVGATAFGIHHYKNNVRPAVSVSDEERAALKGQGFDFKTDWQYSFYTLLCEVYKDKSKDWAYKFALSLNDPFEILSNNQFLNHRASVEHLKALLVVCTMFIDECAKHNMSLEHHQANLENLCKIINARTK